MKLHNIVITEPDMERLRYLLDPVRRPLSKDQEHLDVLEQELDRAQILSPGETPPEVVTMNSRVRLKNLTTGAEMTYTLVFPKDADLKAGKISVLAPIGTAILGYRAGDVIAWNVPGGKRKFRIEEVLYQPEAASRPARVFGQGITRLGDIAEQSLRSKCQRGDRVNEVADLSRRDSPRMQLKTRAVKRVIGTATSGKKRHEGVNRCLEHSKNMLNVFTARAQAC